MFKKLLIVAGLVSVVGFLRWGTKFPAKAEEYGDKVVTWVDKKVKSRTPADRPEEKLVALRGRLKDIDAEIASAKDKLAQQIVDRDRATVEVVRLRGEVDTNTKVLTARAKEIDETTTEMVGYNGQPMAVPAARKRLDRDLDLVAAQKTLLARTEDAARQREEGVAVLRQHVAELEGMKLEAKTTLDRLDLELKSLRMQEVKDRFDATDTKAGKFLEAVKELEEMIEVKKVRRSLDPEKSVAAPAPEATKPLESAADAVARKLGLKPEKKIEKAGD
jgi:hypothetical protein